MTATQGTSGFGTLLQRGDGGSGAGVQASRSHGSADGELVIRWKAAGTAGNSKHTEIIENGNNTALSVTVTTSKVTINLATDGAGEGTSTPNDVIAALYANPTFVSYWEADNGAGAGTSPLTADFADAALSGGTAGVEEFTTIAEVTNISGPGRSLETIDATHMESTDAYREYLPSLKDGGELNFDLNYLPADANQLGLSEDMENRIRRNFRIVWTDVANSTDQFSGYVTSFEPSAQIDDKLSASCTIKVTGAIQRL